MMDIHSELIAAESDKQVRFDVTANNSHFNSVFSIIGKIAHAEKLFVPPGRSHCQNERHSGAIARHSCHLCPAWIGVCPFCHTNRASRVAVAGILPKLHAMICGRKWPDYPESTNKMPHGFAGQTFPI